MADALLETLIALTSAHLVADFVLQSDAMVKRKREPLVLSAHIAIVTGITVIALGWFAWPIILWIALTHLTMDLIKIHLLGNRLPAFIVDQTVHFAVIAGLAIAYPDAAERGLWSLLPAVAQPWFQGALAVIAALTAATLMGGVMIEKVLKPLVTPDIAAMKGLREGGRYIGWLERGLTILFVIMGEPTGVGLLLAAKSILRFGDIKNTEDRARAEYIMIGTFLSIGWALPIAAIARRTIEHLFA